MDRIDHRVAIVTGSGAPRAGLCAGGARPARPRRTNHQFSLRAEPLMRRLTPTGDR